MPKRVMGMLLGLLGLAASAFGFGLHALTQGRDLLAALVFSFGAVSLWTLATAMRVAKGQLR